LLVTGFTGFLGKLTVTKILTSCSDVQAVYVLMRKGTFPTVRDRLSHILDSKVFSKLKDHDASFHEKIIPVEGDVVDMDLGLSHADKSQILEKISVIIHLAQISNCNSPLKVALEVNVHGTRNLLTLAKQMTKLSSIVHLSTVYSNCNHPTIGEIIYQPALNPNKVIGASQWVSDEIFKDIENFIMKGHANAFTYSKSLSEYLIQEEFPDLPVSVVRPAIIGSTWREPFPDWIDNNSGIVPIVRASGRGNLRVLKGNPKSTAEIIPADSVVNTLLAVAWYKSEKTRDTSAQVFNLTSNASRRLTWQSLEQIVCSSYRKNPLDSVLRIPEASMTQNNTLYSVKNGLFHVFPAYAADLINLLLGRSTHYVTNMKQFLTLLRSNQYFTTRDWKIENSNVKELMSELTSADKKVFSIDTSCTHWPSYIEGLCLGVKQYVLKEKLSGLPAARAALNRIRWADRFWNFVIFLVFIRLASTRLVWAKKVWNVILAAALYIYTKIPKIAKS